MLALLPFLLAGARCICAALSGEGRPLTLGSRTRRKPAGEAIGVVMPAPALGFFCCLSCGGGMTKSRMSGRQADFGRGAHTRSTSMAFSQRAANSCAVSFFR